jgi:hypothetical protein
MVMFAVDMGICRACMVMFAANMGISAAQIGIPGVTMLGRMQFDRAIRAMPCNRVAKLVAGRGPGSRAGQIQMHAPRHVHDVSPTTTPLSHQGVSISAVHGRKHHDGQALTATMPGHYGMLIRRLLTSGRIVK